MSEPSQRYTVIGLVDATVYQELEASSPEEAHDRAVLGASVCFQCAQDLEVGDVYDVQVLDEDGVLVIPFEADAEPARLRAEVDRMKAETTHLRQRVFGLEERVHTLRRDLRSIAHHETDDPYRAAAESLDEDNGRVAILAKLEAKDE